MAFACYSGIQMQNDTLDSMAGPNAMPLGGVRVLAFQNISPDIMAQRVQRLKNAVDPDTGNPSPKFVVCLLPTNNGKFDGQTVAQYETFCRNMAEKVDADVFEICNEPGVAAPASAVGGKYWDFLRVGADAVHEMRGATTPCILAAPTPAPALTFYSNGRQTAANQGWDFRDYITGFAIHPYANVANGAQAAYNKMTQVRNHVNSAPFPSYWQNFDMYCTECGWHSHDPAHPFGFPPGNEQGTTPNTVSAFVREFFELAGTLSVRTALRLRFAGYFTWTDYQLAPGRDEGARFCGITKLTNWQESMESIYPNGGSPSGRNTTYNPAVYPGMPGSWNVPNFYAPFRESYTILRQQVPVGWDLAPAAPAPTVNYTTSGGLPPAGGITQTSAGLHGSVNPNGTGTTRYFQWGQTTAYGNSSPPVSVGAGSSPVDAHYSIPTGTLLPNTTYHFRLRASNASTTLGSDQTFTTLASTSVAPTVTTGPVTSPTTTGATLNGTINPQGQAVSNYHFEYGATTAYGTSTTAQTLPVGTVDVAVTAVLSSLTAGSTVHYRLVATNASGTTNGADKSFVVTTPPTGTIPDRNLAALAILSTLLTVEVTTADGRSFRWDVDDTEATNRPLGVAFSTQAGDGFAEASCSLPRSIAFDWPDLHILDRIRFIGSDGSIAYEGRVVATPRRVGDEGEVIEIQAQGLMASARDRTFTQIIVDRSGDRWQPPSLALRKAIYLVGTPLDADWTASADSGSLMFKGGTLKRMSAGSQAALQYIAPTGQKLAGLQYTGDQKQFNANDDTTAELHATDDDSAEMGTWDKVSLTLDGTGIIQTAALTTARRYLGLRARTVTAHGSGDDTAPGPSPTSPALRRYDKIAVYGNHGIEPRPNGEDPDGVYASDVITWLIERYCPLLNAENVEQSQTPIAHLVFDTPTQPFDAMSLVNGFHLWQLGAWENGSVTYAPVDFRNIDWQIRSDDPGVTLDLQGDSVDSFANGIVVSYTDVQERQVNLFPDVQGDLRDDDPDNPANRQGIQLWTSIEVSNPMDLRGALALGRVALREFNRPKAPGSITVNLGYVEDGQGNLQPGWKMRAGHTLAITNLPGDQPRLISATSWTEDGSLQITLEQPPTRIDAVLARFEMDAQVYRKTRRPALGRQNG